MSNLNEIIKNEIYCYLRENISNEDVVFHGSNTKFEVFDLSYINSGAESQAHGYGVYLTDSREYAQCFGNIMYTVEIPDVNKKTYLFQDIKPSKSIINKVYNKLFKYLIKNDYEGQEDGLRREMECFFNIYDGEMLYGTVKSFLGDGKKTGELFNSCNIYGIVFKMSDSNNGYVIFNENDVHILKSES